MDTRVCFHGASGDNILKIIETGVMRPVAKNEIFLARYNWQSCLMHGADLQRQAAFVIQVQLDIPEGAALKYIETPGVRDTLKIQTTVPVPVKVLELYVRPRMQEGEVPEVIRVIGEEAIKQYLNG